MVVNLSKQAACCNAAIFHGRVHCRISCFSVPAAFLHRAEAMRDACRTGQPSWPCTQLACLWQGTATWPGLQLRPTASPGLTWRLCAGRQALVRSWLLNVAQVSSCACSLFSLEDDGK